MTIIDEVLCAAVTAHPRAKVLSFRYTQFSRNHKHLLAVGFNFTAGNLGLVGPCRFVPAIFFFERVPAPGGLILLFTYKFLRLRSSVIIIAERCLV